MAAVFADYPPVRHDIHRMELYIDFAIRTIPVIASDKKLMHGQPSSRLGWTVVAITTVAMFAAGVAMFVV